MLFNYDMPVKDTVEAILLQEKMCLYIRSCQRDVVPIRDDSRNELILLYCVCWSL